MQQLSKAAMLTMGGMGLQQMCCHMTNLGAKACNAQQRMKGSSPSDMHHSAARTRDDT